MVDTILEAKAKIAKYKKHFDILTATKKIEIQENIEKMQQNIAMIDAWIYKFYDLDHNETEMLKGK